MSRTMMREDLFMGYQVKLLTLVLGSVFAVGCAAKSNPALDEARAAYQRASSNEFVAKNAPVSLYEAQAALETAETTFKDGDKKDVDSLAYVALRRVEIAEQLAAKNAAQEELAGLGTRRTKTLLEARDAELTALKGKKTERGLMITLGDVLFEFAKADLKAGSIRDLDRLVSLLKEYPERNLLIEGHTDDIGADSSNLLLSQRRAEAVANALTSAGVEYSRITSRGLGESYPVTSNETPAGRQQNRRVEIYVLPEGQSGAQSVR